MLRMKTTQTKMPLLLRLKIFGEDLQADYFINLDENGKPVKNYDALPLFNWTNDEASDKTEVQENR